ncbi:hypothetical protein ILYODFUR_009770 [Ilyodon furcidens]|uniref:Schwannomin interacting protein 1 n=1 Tax=Ilyodon furcidens TaxID=33524 RepID=A0ABV0SYP6_9TELE
MTDYREDGMDLGSDASSRSSSESNSNKVTPCSPSLDLANLEDYKSSPSPDLGTLDDYEEDEDYQEYKKKVIEEWESEYGEDQTSPRPPGQEDGRGNVVSSSGLDDGYRKAVNARSLAEEFQDVKTVPPLPAPGGRTASSVASVPDELKQNGNLILPRSNQLHSLSPAEGGSETPKPIHRSSNQGRGSRSSGRGGGGGGGGGGDGGGGESGGTCGLMRGYREEEESVEEEPLPTMDWAALERHLAGLQCREQENQNLNQNHNIGKTNYTSHPVCLILHPITFRRLAFKGPSAVFILACQLSSSLLHPTSTIFLHIYSWLPCSLAANPPPVSDQGEDISKAKPYKCSF